MNGTGVRSLVRALALTGALILSTTVAVSAPERAEAAASDIRLTMTATDPALVRALRDALPDATVSQVVDSANRTARACSAPVAARAASFCWNAGDSAVEYWMPQGITTSSDAHASGTVDGVKVMITSWYDTGSSGVDRGVRITFVDLTNPTTPSYRHVLLVEPYWNGSTPDFRRLPSHAGGLVWYGDKLYVNDTYDGMRVFDMDDLVKVSTGDAARIGRQSDGRYMAHDYLYVLPQSGRYVPSTTGGEPRVRYSQTSLDRTTSPDSLVVSEYGNPGDGTRMVRFALDETTRLVAADSDGTARADWSFVTSFRSVQGATSVNGRFYAFRSNGSSTEGDLIAWRQGEHATIHTGALPVGPEDVTYWSQTGLLWSSTEYPNQRYVFATRLSAW